MIAPAAALAAIPDELPAEEAAPFMCAAVAVYNALRNSAARSGDVVAVHGIGGLGHLRSSVRKENGVQDGGDWAREGFAGHVGIQRLERCTSYD